jgi:hypothetical protein
MWSQSQLRQAWAPPCRGPWVTVSFPGAGRISVRPSAAEAFRALAQTFAAYGYVTRQNDTGAYVCRRTTGGSSYSLHAYGIASDTNWNSNPYGTKRTDRPAGLNSAIVRIRTNNGQQAFNNGIFWRSGWDPMHDEIVTGPRDLATGINWSTVPGRSAAAPPAVDYKALRRWLAGDLYNRVITLPIMWLNTNAGSPLYVVTLQQALNLVRQSAMAVDGIYGTSTETNVKAFQTEVNRIRPGTITENAGTFGPQTKWMLATALKNIRDGITP